MDVRIGVSDHTHELVVQLPDDTNREQVKADIDAAIGGDSLLLWLTDNKGKEVAIVSTKIAFIELSPKGGSPIGFG